MSKKHFSALLLVTVVVAVLVLLVPGKTSKESSFQKHLLLPGLAALVNEIDYVQVSGAGGETIATLNRREGKWLVAESFDYLANWPVLRQLLSDLAVAEVVEGKTSNPKFYSRLGVQDMASPEASGVQIGFARETGVSSVIVGNKAQGREGQYVRLSGAGQSLLIDRVLNVPGDMQQWLGREIIDIQEGELVEVSIRHPDNEQILLLKVSADDTDFELQKIPEGREILSHWTVNSIAGGLVSLTLDAVVPESEIDWTDAVQIRFLAADGLRVSAQLVSAQEQFWISLRASADQAADFGESTNADPESEGVPGLTERLRRINDRVSAWAYAIPRHKAEVMTKRMDDLLNPLEAE